MTSIDSRPPATPADWENLLRDASITGKIVDLGGTDPIDPADAETWSAARRVPAEALRRVLARTDEKTLDPRGLRIRGAWFCEELSLTHSAFPRPLHFLGCAFDAPIDLNGAKLKELSFAGSHIGSLAMDNAEVLDDVVLSEVKAVGKISAIGAKIGGRLIMTGARLSNGDDDDEEPVLHLECARVGGDVLLNKGFDARGEVLAVGVRIGGQLNLRGATLRNPGADALSLDSAEISGSVLARRKYTKTVTWQFRAYGTIRALEARIGGRIEFDGAFLHNPNNYVIDLDGAEIRGKLTARKGFNAFGAIRAVGARIGDCDFREAGLWNCSEDTCALNLDGADIARRVYAKGIEVRGLVSAVGATIAGDLDLSGATLYRCSLREVVVNLDRAEIGGDLLATDGFKSHATIRALSTQIGGKFDLTGAKLHRHARDADDALLLRSATIGRLVLRPLSLQGVDLSRAEIAVLETGEALPMPLTATGWKIADLHGSLRSDTAKARHWLNSYPQKVTPVQPWWALADVYERNGDTAAARRMRFFAANKVTVQSTLRRPALLRGAYGAVAGYGYYPLVAIIWLAFVIVLGYCTVTSARQFIVPTNNDRAVAAMQVGEHRGWAPNQGSVSLGNAAAVHGPLSSRPPTAETPCSSHPGYPCWNGFTFTLNSLVSAWGNPGADWTIRGDAPFQLTLALFLLKVFAWGLLGLLLAGVTGLLRKS